MSKPPFADEQSARLNAIGLTDEASIAANENAPTRSELYGELGRWVPMSSMEPGVLPLSEIIDRANADGFVDVRLGRPPSAAIRFIEQRLHYNCMESFPQYVEVYERAWKAGSK